MNAWKFTIYYEDVTVLRADSAPLDTAEGLGLDVAAAFGKALRQQRKEAGLTQEQLALQADVQRNYVSLIERGMNQPSIAIIFKLASALGCSPTVLVSKAEQLLAENA